MRAPHCTLGIIVMDSDYDFVEKPSEDFFCPVSLALLLKPYLTVCCGNHLSEETYQQLQENRKSCPLCNEKGFQAVKDKYHRRKVMSLKVRCPHKAKDCKWEGELGSLEQHLSADGECGYVDVDCPYACGENVQRRNMKEHQFQFCLLRPCNCCQHCKDKVQEMSKKLDKQEAEIEQLKTDVKESGERLLAMVSRITPIDIVLDNVYKHKRDLDVWFSPPFYSSIGGYKMCLKVDFSKTESCEAGVCIMRGEFDKNLKWPFPGEVRLKVSSAFKFKDKQIFRPFLLNKCVRKPDQEINEWMGNLKLPSNYFLSKFEFRIKCNIIRRY